jgi:hypothetical protein
MVAIYVVAALFVGWLAVMLYRVRRMVLVCRGVEAAQAGGTGIVASRLAAPVDVVNLTRAFDSAGACVAGVIDAKAMESTGDLLAAAVTGSDVVCGGSMGGNSRGSENVGGYRGHGSGYSAGSGGNSSDCIGGCGNNGDAMSHKLAVLVQDQADIVEAVVHRLAASLRHRPGLRVVLLDGGSADETGLILERLARHYNMEFHQLVGDKHCPVGTTIPGITYGPIRCLDLRGIPGGKLMKFDLCAMELR